VCYMMLDLFSDDKSMQVLFFVPALMCAGARIAIQESRSAPCRQEI